MRFRTLLLAFALGTGVAQAQVVSPLGGSTGNPQRPATPAPTAPPTTSLPTTTTPAVPTTAGAPTHTRKTLAERFAAANTTHDGKLTLEQARSGRLRAVVRDYDQIDKTKRGYVTLDEIKAHQADQRAARRAARTTPTRPTTTPAH